MSCFAEKLLGKLPPYTTCANLINLKNLQQNYNLIRNMVSRETICASVVKADAYGLNANIVTKSLIDTGCRHFFVATVDEGIAIRQASLDTDTDIYVLGGVLKCTEHYFTEYKLTPVIVNFEQFYRWINYSKYLNKKLDCIIHIDTGMARNGFSISEAKDLAYNNELTRLNIKYIMSHLACADDPENIMNKKQLARFEEATSLFPGIKRSLSSTNGIFLGKEYQFDLVRPGKALYGFAVRPDYIGTFSPVVHIYAKILQINHLNAGDNVGYGATFTADRPMTTATIGMGYADGFMRKYSGCGCVYINGQKANVIGRISMDYCVVDITNLTGVRTENWATIADDAITLEQFALDNASLPHEITCKLGPRVRKVYID